MKLINVQTANPEQPSSPSHKSNQQSLWLSRGEFTSCGALGPSGQEGAWPPGVAPHLDVAGSPPLGRPHRGLGLFLF